MHSKGDTELLRLVLGSGISRRTLLKGLGGALGLAAIGCGDGDSGPGGDGGVAAGTLFEMLEQLRGALRQSPDHLVQRAEDLVAARDAEGLFELVRDRIATYPTSHKSVERPDRIVRWGARATLRGGAGTPREKAELLRDLYVRAGFTADLVAGRVAEPPADWEAWLLRPVERPFAPAVDEAQIAQWRENLGLSASEPVPEIDPSGAAADALVDQLLPAINPSNFNLLAFDFRASSLRLPVVRVEIDGELRFANPSVPGAVFGKSYLLPEDEELAAPAAEGLLDIEIALLAATTDAPGERLELLRRSYAPDELLGRQLVISTMPGVPVEAWPAVTFADVRAVVPTFAVQGNDAAPEELQRLTATGDAITVDGQTVTFGEDGSVRVGDSTVVDPSRPAPELSSVQSLAIDSIDAASFGEITVRARAFDAAGELVEGLPAEAFEVSEDGEPVGFLLRANARQPRVIVLSDDSLSMPPEYRGEAGRDFVELLAAEIQKSEPHASFQFETSDSRLWTALARVARKQPTLIIYLTDGDVVDERTPEIEAVLRAGPPALLLAVDGASTPTLEEMASLTGGAVVPVGEVADAVAKASEFIGAQDVPPYVLSYTAPAEGPAQRTVRLALSSGEIEDSAQYTVPAQPAQPQQLSGLYLSVRVGTTEVMRTLAGNLHRTEGPVPAADVDATRDALFGTVMMSFEGGLPSHSQWLDDIVSAKLSLQPLFDATTAGDADMARAAFSGGLRHVPPELFTVHAPLPVDDQQLVFESGIRTTIYSERPRFGTEEVVRRIDVLPTARIAVAARGTELELIERAMRATARTAIAENALFAESTAELLDGAELLVAPVGNTSVYRNHPELSDDEKARWEALLEHFTDDVRLVPSAGAPRAYWSVDYTTGALLGILGDGSGGGSIQEKVTHIIKMVDKLAAYFNLLATAAGTGVAMGLVINHGQLLARLYGAVTVTIALLDAAGLDKAIREALANFACNAIRTLLRGAMGQTGTRWGNIASVITLLTDSTAVSCPG